MRFLVITVV